MQLFFYTTVLLAAAQGSLGAIPGLRRTDNNGCNANNCARAVTGTRSKVPDITSRAQDCSSFMRTTVGPGTTIIPTQVPAYASDCSGSSAYSSACSCWGIKPVEVPAFQCGNPGTCGTFVIINDPSCGDLQVCTCAFDADGRSVCVEDQLCSSAKQCGTDSDCAFGEVCWADNCCGVNICTKPSSICVNPARVMAHFAEEANVGCTGARCAQ